MASDAVDSVVANEHFLQSDAAVARLCGARRGQWDVLSVAANRPLFRPIKCSGVVLVQENRRQFVHHVSSASFSVSADASSLACTGVTSRSREVRPIASAHSHHVMCSALNYSLAKTRFHRQPTALRTRSCRKRSLRWVPSSSTSSTRSSRTLALRASFSIRSLNTCGASSASASSLSGESPLAYPCKLNLLHLHTAHLIICIRVYTYSTYEQIYLYCKSAFCCTCDTHSESLSSLWHCVLN